MIFEEVSGKEVVETISRNTLNMGNNLGMLSMPNTLEYEKYNPEHVLLLNGFIQVMLGASLYSKYINSSNTTGDSVQFLFTNNISTIEFYSDPIVNQLMSVFKRVRPIGFEKNVIGLWANEPLPDAIEAYKSLLAQGKIDPCMTELFKEKGRFLSEEDIRKPHKIYEIKQEALNENKEDIERKIINSKFLMYTLTTSKGYQGSGSFLLYGWTQEEICNCQYINDLKTIFERVFVMGSGEPWLSTSVIPVNPREELFYYPSQPMAGLTRRVKICSD